MLVALRLLYLVLNLTISTISPKQTYYPLHSLCSLIRVNMLLKLLRMVLSCLVVLILAPLVLSRIHVLTYVQMALSRMTLAFHFSN